MANRQSTSKSSGARNRVRGRIVDLRAAGLGSPRNGSSSATLEEVLVHQLARLTQAESILGCLRVALLYEEDRGRTADPDYARTAGVALKLVREAVDALDSTTVKPFIAAFRSNPSSVRGDSPKRRPR